MNVSVKHLNRDLVTADMKFRMSSRVHRTLCGVEYYLFKQKKKK